MLQLFSKSLPCAFLLLLCTTIMEASPDGCFLDKYYIIRNPKSGLVLEARGSEVRLHYHTGYNPQLWKFSYGNEPGLFYIMNHNGKVMDLQSSNENIKLNEQNNSLDQQWYIHPNGTIANAQKGHVINLDSYLGFAGNIVEVWRAEGLPSQVYQFQEVADSRLVQGN